MSNTKTPATPEEAAKKYATQMMGIGEFSEKWNHADKYMFYVIENAYKAGQASKPEQGMKWVSIDDKHHLEQFGYSKRVLCCTDSGNITVGFLLHGMWIQNNGRSFNESGYNVTHWMPLPEPPPTHPETKEGE